MSFTFPDRQEIERFLHGELGAEDNRRIVRQLLAADGLGEARLPALALRSGLDDGRAFARKRDALDLGAGLDRRALDLVERAVELEAERRRAPYLEERLAAVPFEDRKAAIRRDDAFHTWALCELLIERCHERIHEETSLAEEIAECAVTVAEELDPAYYGPSLVQDIEARAWAAIGEMLRSTSDLRSAEDAFVLAETLAADGTGDALEEAWILELKATLRRDQRRTPEAHRLLDEVISIYRQYRDFHLVGRAFVQKGRVFGAAGECEPAIQWLRKGLALLDPAREPRLELIARHSLILYLNDSGRHEEAWFMLQATRPDFARHGGNLLNLRLRWLEGKVHEALGRTDEAEAAFLDARRGFITQEIGFDAAMVCLDLASLYTNQDRAVDMRRVAQEMLPVFHSRDLHQEAIAALIVFQQAAARERVSSDLLHEMGTYLQRARRDYKLRFEYPV